MKKKKTILLFVALSTCLIACSYDYSPKPRAYFRIALPEHQYQKFDTEFPYKFEHPVYSKVAVYIADSAWINVDFPQFNAKIHITYHKVEGGIDRYIEQTRNLAYKHSIKADAINEREYYSPERRVFGILYDIKGNAASQVNFFLTDSTTNFFRGALYFNNKPNKDSIAPVVEFLKEDIFKLMETFHWTEIPELKKKI